MDLYDAIFYRKSTKKFSQKKLNEELFKEIINICNNLDFNNHDIKAHMIERGHLIHLLMGKKFDIKSPHYILLTSNKEDCFLDIGFIAEEIILKLTVLGVATCYVDTNFKFNEINDIINKYDEEEILEENKDEEEVIITQILIAVGYSENDNIFRDKSEKLDRKPIKNICKDMDKKYKELFDVIELSPSYKNCQPWVISNYGKRFDIYMEKSFRYSDKMIKISMGAFLKHFDLYFEKEGKSVEYKKVVSKRKSRKKNLFDELRKKYLVSAIIE